MDPDAIALFRELADRSPSEREEYYARHRVPAGLRAEVESLLRFDGETVDAIHGRVAAAARVALESLADPLASGTRLGPYEIVAPIGAGGMGEVYRALDTRLGRHVAVKVLPAEVSGRPDAFARFEREARAVAALSHPNILAIHDFGTDGGTTYAVTELLDGATVRDTLADRPLSVRRAVEYAIQIAHGLAAAHDRGIVHRDLKPDNIFVTTDERVKILDFGLARQGAPAGAARMTVAHAQGFTAPGTVLGTVGYMAPEQVRGVPADSRSDLFSFGAVLYEMLSGRRAFQRETAAETMTAILHDDPPPPEPDRAVPPALDSIVRHCLEKKPGARFQSAHDLAFALSTVAESALPSPSVGFPGSPVSMRARQRWLLTAAGLMIADVGIAGVVGMRRPGGATAGVTVVQPPRFQQLTFEDGNIGAARFAPDGRTIVYSSSQGAGDPRLWQTRLEFPGSAPLSIPNGLLFAVSKQAEMLVGLDPRRTSRRLVRRTTLARLPLLGGAPRPILEEVTFADWSPVDDAIAVVRVAGSQQRLEFPVGTVLFQTEGEIGWPRVSPDGRHVAFLDWPVKNDDRGSVVIVDLKGSRNTVSQTWESVWGLAWAPAGDEVWYTAAPAAQQHSVWGSAVGRAERRIFTAPGSLVLHDVANDGKVLVARSDRTIRVEAMFSGDASIRDLTWLGGLSGARDISRDGTRVLLSHFGAGSSSDYDVYVRGSHDLEATRVGEGQGQQFSPDGTQVLTVVHGPPPRVVILPIGPGAPKPVPTGAVQVTLARWLPDGRRLLVIGTEPSKGVRAYVTDVAGSTPRPITPEGVTHRPDQVALSHDGAWAALRSPEGVITLYSIDGQPPIAAKGFPAGELPFAWTSDNRALLVQELEAPRRIVAVDPTTGRRELFREVIPSDASLSAPGQIFLTPDARSFVANYQELRAALFLAEGLR